MGTEVVRRRRREMTKSFVSGRGIREISKEV